MSFTILETALYELADALDGFGCKLIIGGGFGLYLCQIAIADHVEIETLIPRENWCEPRTTSDIDIFLETTIVASLGQMQSIRAALDALGYTVIADVKYLHFEKTFGPEERVELNFLTGPITDQSLSSQLKFNRPRVRPKGDVELHAYLTDEAIGLSEHLIPVSQVEGGTRAATKNIFVPHPSTFLIMKLHAFRDRVDEPDKASQHAIDIYRVICMMSEADFKQTKIFLRANSTSKPALQAAHITKEYFGSLDQMGFIRLREHPLSRSDFPLGTLRDVLLDLAG